LFEDTKRNYNYGLSLDAVALLYLFDEVYVESGQALVMEACLLRALYGGQRHCEKTGAGAMVLGL
jgi:hypothetical protein